MTDTIWGPGPHGEPKGVVLLDPLTGDPVGTATLGGVVLKAGSAIVGKVGIDQTTDGTTNHVHVNANKATYVATAFAYGAYATPTDMFSIFGSASKTIAVTRFAMAIHSTAAALQVIDYIKRSAANSGGTPTVLAATPYDSASAVATAVVSTYAAAPTTGAAVGTIRTSEAPSGTLTASPGTFAENNAGAQPQGWQMATNLASPIILRGVAEGLCMNYKGAALTVGFTAYCIAEWVEY